MAKMVFKYQLPIKDTFTLDIPAGADILAVQIQHENPCLWALVEKDAPPVTRHFACVGTGQPVPTVIDKHNYIGTVQRYDGNLVLHYFILG